MIKFFRKIRQKLLTENKFSKYLLYAIGEILLVVIGILIALQINNANEKRKSALKTDDLLEEVYIELALNIKKASKTIETYRAVNNKAYRVLRKKVTYDDYKNDFSLSLLLLNSTSADLKDEAFNNLMNNKGEVSEQQDSIISNLVPLYKNLKSSIDIIDEQVLNNLYDFRKELRNTKDWYGDYWVSQQTNEESIAYFLNDPFYYNKVVSDFEVLNLGEHFYNTSMFRNEALILYKELASYLNLDRDSSLAAKITEYNQFIGTYVLQDDGTSFLIKEDSTYTLKIEREAENLVIKAFSYPDSTNTSSIYLLYPDSKNSFTWNHVFVDFTRNENDGISGLTLTNGTMRELFKKIK